MNASFELRSKKALIENFIAGGNIMEDVMIEWHNYIAEKREEDLQVIIHEEKLKEPETRKFMQIVFCVGFLRTTGTDFEKMLPPVSRFGGGGNLEKKKQIVVDKLKNFFEKYYSINGKTDFTKNWDNNNLPILQSQYNRYKIYKIKYF